MRDAIVTTVEGLAELADAARREGRRIVLCHGTFDLLHMGHIRHLKRARREGDVLFVSITADAHVNKGPGRPVFCQEMRAESLASLACVDAVAVHHGPTGIEVIEAVRPDVYAKGSDYRDPSSDLTGNIQRERAAVEAVGGRIVFTDEIAFSSTQLLNEHFGIFPPRTRQFLEALQRRYGAARILEQIRALRHLRVLVVGDTIIDEYHYTTPLGQPGKGYGLAVRLRASERFAGGAVAVANHLASFAGSVTLATGLGSLESHEDFVRERLLPGVEPRFFYSRRNSTLIKRRFVDGDLNKLFEIYLREGEDGDCEQDVEAAGYLSREAGRFDLVVVPDFGNGFIGPRMVDTLCGASCYLAVNTQINSGNRGYHTIHRYPRVDFVSLNEPELRLAAHNRSDPVDVLAEQIGSKLGARAVATTLGTEGLRMLDRASNRVTHVPALSTSVVDRIGAGDAFLSLAALCLRGGMPAELAAFVGGAAAALAVQVVCNREPVGPVRLFKYLTTLLRWGSD